MSDAHPSQRDLLADFRTDGRVLLLSLMALPIGVLGACVAQALLWLIAVITNLAFHLRLSAEPLEPAHHALGVGVVLVPVVGAVLIGLMARYGSEKIRGHGIPEALEAILLGRSLMDPKVAVLKPLSSAVSIGTGGPFGAEGPIIMTGGAFGSIFAQLFHLSAAERKTLLVAGAAAGMSAVFATPVAAVLLAVELLLFEWKPRSFIPVAAASVVAALVRIPLLGRAPLFPLVVHGMPDAGVLGAALVIGVCAGLASAALTLLIYAVEDQFPRLPVHWMWWPAIGGLVVGIGGLIDPRVLGVGYDVIHGLLRGELVGGAAVGLLLAKGVVWAVALGSGTSGGVLAPLLMIGGALGTVMAPGLGLGDAGVGAMLGMGAIMGGTMRAPLTGMLFVLELTHDFEMLPALLVSCVAALCVTVLLMRRSILTEKLARRGQHIAREYGVDVFEVTRVGEAMDRDPPLVPADGRAADLAVRIARGDAGVSRRQAAFVVDGAGALAGIVTRGDLVRALGTTADPDLTVLDACTRDPLVTHADVTLHDALLQMLKHDIGRLPVVARDDRRIVGYLGRAEILTARLRHEEEEQRREKGPMFQRRRP